MPGLSSNTRLRWIEDLRIRLDSSRNVVEFSAGSRTVRTTPPGAALPDLFRKPTTMAEAAAELNRRMAGRAARMEVTLGIMELYSAGLLVDDADGTPPRISSRSESWGGGRVHIALLNDRRRTEGFLAAIREVVRPGDVVVDLGTGTGVLAIAAAQAGAARVYAVEATGIGKLAEANFRANGLQDQITLVPGWSMTVDLPERADVLVGELIGNDPFDEQIIESAADARARFLKPDARMVPRRVNVFALPVTVPDRMIRRHLFTPEVLEAWRSWYGIDFGALARSAPSSLSFPVSPSKLCGCALADPVLVATTDLPTKPSSPPAADREFVASVPGRLNGVMIHFELELAPGIRLSTHPDRADRRCNWAHRVWVLPEPLPLEPGARYRLTWRHGRTDLLGGARVFPAGRAAGAR